MLYELGWHTSLHPELTCSSFEVIQETLQTLRFAQVIACRGVIVVLGDAILKTTKKTNT